jgi:hypothetical protein
MALARYLIGLVCSLFSAGFKPEGTIPGPDVDRVESRYRVTQYCEQLDYYGAKYTVYNIRHVN